MEPVARIPGDGKWTFKHDHHGSVDLRVGSPRQNEAGIAYGYRMHSSHSSHTWTIVL